MATLSPPAPSTPLASTPRSNEYVRSRVSSNASSLSPISPLPSPLHRPDGLPGSRPQTPMSRQVSSSSSTGAPASSNPSTPIAGPSLRAPHWEVMCESLPEDLKFGLPHFEARRRAWLGKDPLVTDNSLGLQPGTVDTPETEMPPPATIPVPIPASTSVQSSDSSSPRTPHAKLPHSQSPRGSTVLSSTAATIDLARAAPLDPPGTDVPRTEVLPTASGTAFVSFGPSHTQPGHPPIPHLSPSTLRAHAKSHNMRSEPSSGPVSPRGFSMGPRGHGAAFAQVADERVLAILSKEGKLSDEDWRTLRGVHTALMGGQRLRVPMPMDKLVKLLQAGWQRDGTWPPGADAPDY